MGGVLPTVMPEWVSTTAIPIELLIVPLGLSVATRSRAVPWTPQQTTPVSAYAQA